MPSLNMTYGNTAVTPNFRDLEKFRTESAFVARTLTETSVSLDACAQTGVSVSSAAVVATARARASAARRCRRWTRIVWRGVGIDCCVV